MTLDNQIIKKPITTNIWYRGIMAGIRLHNMTAKSDKKIPIKHIAIKDAESEKDQDE